MKLKSVILLFITLIGLPVFGNNLHSHRNDHNNPLALHLNATTQILLHTPEACLGYKQGKFYIDESAFQMDSLGVFLDLGEAGRLYLPDRLVDAQGAYLVGCLSSSWKPFKCVCDHCDYEWEGNAFTVRCPECGKTEWHLEPND